MMVKRVIKRRVSTVKLPTWDCLVERLCGMYEGLTADLSDATNLSDTWQS